jgi:hypothetical protein
MSLWDFSEILTVRKQEDVVHCIENDGSITFWMELIASENESVDDPTEP